VADQLALVGTPAERTQAGEIAEEKVSVAAQWQLMWWRLRKHRLALASAVVLLCFYLVAIAAEFFASADPSASSAQQSFMTPQPIHFFDNGSFSPFVYGVKGQRDPKTLLMQFVPDAGHKVQLQLFGRGVTYRLFGLIPMDRHLLGSAQGDPFFLLGTDQQGRDLWSRLVYGTRTSLSIGLVGVLLSLLIGVTLGGFSGYYGGGVDLVIQRVIEIARSIPTIPLWLGIAALLPQDWSVVQVYFAITLIISLIGWTELARVVRGRFLSLREEEFVTAARLYGCSQKRIIFRHMVPLFTSHIIAATTLAIPAMVISETALSFLGLGLRPPAISWGVLLQAAQNVQTVATAPWLMIPAIPVVLVVLAFNFLGDGLRDAADPYGV